MIDPASPVPQIDATLDAELRDALVTQKSFSAGLEVLTRYRDAGFLPIQLYPLLEHMRHGAGEEAEDAILLAMDIVIGFCHPSMRLWPKQDSLDAQKHI